MDEQNERPRQDEADEKRQPHEKPISLAPLTFDQAVAGLLQVRPPKKETKPKAAAKKRGRKKA